jgi:hypothetical protein
MKWIRTEYRVNVGGNSVTFAGSLVGPADPEKLMQTLRNKHLSPPTIKELLYLARKAYMHLEDYPEDADAKWIKNVFSNPQGILSFTRVFATEGGVYVYDPTKHRREKVSEKNLMNLVSKSEGKVSYSEDKTIRYLSRKDFYEGYGWGIGNNCWELILGEKFKKTGIPRPKGEEDSLKREIDILVPSQEDNFGLPRYTFVSLKISPHRFEIDGRGREYSNDYTIGVIRRK